MPQAEAEADHDEKVFLTPEQAESLGRGLHGPHTEAEPAGAFTHEEIVTELSFVICERRATIGSIRRERRESEKLKGIRIAICEKMIGRTRAAQAMVEAYPELLAALNYFAFANDWFGQQRFAEDSDADFLLRVLNAMRVRARAAIAKALGPSAHDTSERSGLPRDDAS